MKNQHRQFSQRIALLVALGSLGVFTWLSFEPTSAVISAATMSKFQNQQALIEQGSKLFNPTCSNAYCHGANGAGGSAPSLRDHKLTAEQVARVISEGKPGTAMLSIKNQY